MVSLARDHQIAVLADGHAANRRGVDAVTICFVDGGRSAPSPRFSTAA